MKQIGEFARRTAFNLLDEVHGGEQNRLLEVNRREIVEGVTKEYAKRRISLLLDYAKKQCPFYRGLEQADGLEDFPVQNKLDFISRYDTVLSDEYRDRKDSLTRLTTSGSTGTPFTVLADPEKMKHVNMNFLSVLMLNGFRLGMKRAEFRAWIKGKNTITPWHSFRNNLLMYDISNMGDDHLASICDRISRDHVQALVMYSSALTALTQYVKRKDIDTSAWQVEMIFTMGEACPEATRALANEVFGILPVLSYGNNENGFVAVSLRKSSEYTVDLYNYHVEILKMDADIPAEEGTLGRIVVTDYYNRAFPMIRYDTGDTGKIRTWQDKKGRLHAALTEIYGRRGSLLYNTHGEPLSIHVFMNLLLNFEGRVLQAKCVQTGLATYEVSVIPGKGYREEEVMAAYRKYLGEDARISVRVIDALPIQQSGKTMVCENLCSDYLNR